MKKLIAVAAVVVQTDLKSTTPAAGHPDKSSPVQMSRELSPVVIYSA
ncbi:hypothetical protein H8F52_25525 [Klebsiella pneumoniae]|nr:hypothetical protein [Klebsiella pneumoniae]